ncbi:helix-turn-helix transcriptional regulator [Lutibacter sp. B1]|uniref:helix-turn-helix domain-containing protein n=1 Tax=Lutibacter sp. B1 TaxID=2725996 RepID=UPI001456A7E0|nr:helix-turn-helix transcriptional regulator [Lutibacter sp. B1]
MEEEYIRLIFGLKLKQIRTEKNLSLFGLSKLTNISKSYLNEIEKGKKYPKTDKIALLSQVLETPYDNLVSLKLDKNLAPLGEILQSKILKEIPLDLFGIQEADLIDIISNAPAKVNAFISTLIEIAKHYNLSRESFFLAALRSYQEAHNNYFEDIEQSVEKFAKAYQVNLNEKIKSEDLEEILIEEFNYTIINNGLSQYKNLKELRCVFIPKTKTLLLSDTIVESQKTFIYAKEIAYNYLNLKDRLYTFSWIKFDSFDQVLNNFIASYFAGALIIPKQAIENQLKYFFNQEKWDSNLFNEMITRFTDSPETYYQRLTNILPKVFHFKNLFFLRFTNKEGTNSYKLSKELHITQLQPPTANETHEHYCRRWISIEIFESIHKNEITTKAQISYYPEFDTSYLVISSATPDPFKENYNRSINIGLLISPLLTSKLNFLNDTSILTKNVGVTCEHCPIKDCDVRVCEATELQKVAENETIANTVQQIINDYS